ncbi:uncharacterized protein BDCG_06740 [Blastomyces dermatitidis ER-3]|uniref:Uncharacterized protein n=2 Tax=Blastomyces TaxID=229219 RepID=A0A179UN96_BLAGS|nr:uncharacterized protein BDBG_05310 [Blastomyces gilchristii SLH14081]XP_045278123.1 uncharacterized protein BDCG_06740 [Blastomyces dermatitidis ER-3]EEQ91620.2 hypothetical protein BDCG_06740 [Blastomyces dermatitidis ER-3]OAT09556.1 hypothetical protein BDBG_05310 [Blastomyces gilchristii SLH14081]
MYVVAAEAVSFSRIPIQPASTALFHVGSSPSSIQSFHANRQALFAAEFIKAVRFIGGKRYPRRIMFLKRNAAMLPSHRRRISLSTRRTYYHNSPVQMSWIWFILISCVAPMT